MPIKHKATAKRSRTVTTDKVTRGAILAHLATARNANRTRGVKAIYDNEGTLRLANAIVRAFAIPSLTEAGLTKKGHDMDKGREAAQARREFAKKNRAHLVNVTDILGEGKAGEITHDRPENNLHTKLAVIAKAMGMNAKAFYPIRAEAHKAGEIPQVFIVRR